MSHDMSKHNKFIMTFLNRVLRTNYNLMTQPSFISNMSKINENKFNNLAKQCVPTLCDNKHKGQAGRIGVIGGSLEYTGAPYFSGISALKVGADLVHIFCTQSAAPVIKSYSPEIIVHPLLDVTGSIELIKPWLERLHVVVVGPGLGRDEQVLKTTADIINVCRDREIPLVIDADGLFLITQDPKLIYNYPKPGVILTPNKVEFERFYEVIKDDSSENIKIDFERLGKNVTILHKGKSDQVFSSEPECSWISYGGGTGRRCGGQGDLLSGSTAVFFNWAINMMDNRADSTLAASVACYAGTKLIKLCNEKAFADKGRSMLASDMINYIHSSFEILFENSNENS